MTQLGFWDYLRAAFHKQSSVPMLGLMPINKMGLAAFAVLGLANPGFWLLGAALEVAFLFGSASSARFQKLIRGEMLLRQQADWSGKVRLAVQRLKPESQQRYRRLVGQCRVVLGISETLDADSLGDFRDLRVQSLNQLLGIFLRLLSSREVIIENTRSVDRDRLQGEISRIEQRLAQATPDSALARSLKGTLEIQRRRFENLDRAKESLGVIEAEMERIEQQVELIREESAVGGKPEALSERLDTVTSAMSETSRWMEEHREFFGSLADADDALSALPDVPPAAEGERT